MGLHVTLFAHPHFFIETSLVIEKERLVHTWRFDRLNSKLLIFECDTDKNGILDAKEQAYFLATYIEPLRANQFNLFFQEAEIEQSLIPISLHVSIENKRLVLSFFTPHDFKKPATFCTIDATLYMAYQLESVQSVYAYEVQKSEYDFCLGVNP